MKVVGNEKTSLKIISAKTETTEHELRTCSKCKALLIKVVANEKSSSQSISAQTETSDYELRTCSKCKTLLIKVVGDTVSYTHLKLPTIYSV